MKPKPSYKELERENAELRKRVAELEAELAEVKALLKELLGQNSRNSHKPPSKDEKRYPKTKLKAKGELAKEEDAKEKREGKTLDYKATPDYVEELKLTKTQCNCGQDLQALESYWERIQVYDLPAMALEVLEYQRERKSCGCGSLHEAVLPDGVNRGVQYGSRIKGLANYLHHYQQLPLGRSVELMRDCFGQSMSEASLLACSEKLYGLLEEPEQRILEGLRSSPTVYSDETTLFVEQAKQNVHVRSNEDLTYYHLNSSRGITAHNAIGLLENYAGNMVHDCYQSYFKHEGKHIICHSHTTRELSSVWEQTNQVWALELAQHLIDCNWERQQQPLTATEQADYIQTYKDLIAEGIALNPKQARPPDNKKRGKVKQSKAHNLAHRLLKHEDAATLFIRDMDVPFTNNQAERDLRMVKLKQKISGGFRTVLGAKIFCRIRGFISTIRKQGLNVLDALTKAFQNNLCLSLEQ